MSTVDDWTPNILRNKGCAVDVAVLDKDGERVLAADGGVSTERRFVRFTTNALADLEDVVPETTVVNAEGADVIAYGMGAWQAWFQRKPISTLRTTFAVVFETTPRRAGTMLIEEQIPEYGVACLGAYAIANGVDPLEVHRLMRDLLASRQATRSSSNGVGDAQPPEGLPDFPSTVGSSPG